jgi:hypothetical protein
VIASSFHWRLLIGTILALMAAIWLMPAWLPKPDFQENRVLAAAPALPRHLADIHAFRKAGDAYVADRFPGRAYLISYLNRLRMMVGVSGSERVIVGRQGWLFYDDGTHLGAARNDPPMSGPDLRAWLTAFAGRTENLRARGIAYVMVVAPAKEIIYPQFAPGWLHGLDPNRPTQLLPRLVRQANLGEVIDLTPALAAAARNGPPLYSLHDTHWNGQGAYVGYAALMTRLHALGLTEGPLPESAFVMIPGGPGSSAQPRDLAKMLGVGDKVSIDYPHIINPPGETALKRTFLTDKTDWTSPQELDTGQVGKPTLLLLRDSFSNEMLPLLLPHFSRIILAHNQDGTWRPDLVDRFKPDLVIGETIEHGLRVSMYGSPDPSPQTMVRIDKMLVDMAAHAAAGQALPTLEPASREQAAAIAAAVRTDNCNIETAKLSSSGGQARFGVSGWLSELGRGVTSPHGLIGLKSQAGALLVAPIDMDRPRPDVAAYFKNPNGEASGLVGDFFIRRLPPGTYAPVAYRRAGGGWIGCTGKQALVAP